MDAAQLKTEMKNAVKVEMADRGFNIDNPATNGQADAYIDALCEGIANAMVGHIQSSAETVDLGTQSNPAGRWSIE